MHKKIKQRCLESSFFIPAFVIVILAVLWPLLYEFVLSTYDIKITNMLQIQDAGMNIFKLPKEAFVGLGNFKTILQESFSDPGGFYQIFFRTIIWTFVNVFFHVTLGVFFAILLNRKLPGKAVFRVLLIIPWALPQYIAVLIWKGMFQYDFGAINHILNILGFNSVRWFSDPTATLTACMITNIWLGVPFMMMIALGGLQSIPNELYEAAEIDGANWLGKLRNVTIPLLKPVMVPSIVLGTVWTFNMINVIFIMTDGSSNDNTHILITKVYREAFNSYRYGYSAALSVVIFAILVLFSFGYVKASKISDGGVN